MSDITKETDTQDELNTEVDLEEEIIEEGTPEGDTTPVEQSEIILSLLDDDEFEEYIASGTLPDGFSDRELKEAEGEGEVEDGLDTRSPGTDTDSSKTISDNSGKSLSDTSSNRGDKSTKPEQNKAGGGKSGDGTTSEGKETEKGKTEKESVNYKSIYDSIFKPFKANGKEITPRTVDDVVSLMQMGANYTKKLQTLAPMRKAYESLNKAEIDESELNFLIDVHKGDKEAIKKLLEKHKVDPIELDMDSTNYVPNNNLASDEDVEYSGILDEVQSSLPKINEIIKKNGGLWDNASREIILKDPVTLHQLHEEIEYGRFDEVQSRLEIEKTFGRYKGIPDIQAYKDVLSKMVEEKTSTNTVTKPIQANKPTNTPNKNVPDKSKAAPTKGAKAAVGGTQITPKDIFSISDEEFKKLSARNLI